MEEAHNYICKHKGSINVQNITYLIDHRWSQSSIILQFQYTRHYNHDVKAGAE